jgi:membrane complex biogenesis BtpA family protein
MSRGFANVFRSGKPIIGVIHLPPLPGFAGSPGIDAVIDRALADQQELEAGGVDAVLVENEEDHPHEVAAGPATIAHMARVATAVVAHATRPVGIEILLNDPEASVAVAAASGAAFIRTDYFVDRMERPGYGEMRIDPAGVVACRSRLGAGHVLVLADIQVKYARMLEPRPLAQSAALALEHGADAVVVTGDTTGHAPSVGRIQEARPGAARCPVLVGSGLDAGNAEALLTAADGAIVGTALKVDGRVRSDRVRTIVDIARAVAAARP